MSGVRILVFATIKEEHREAFEQAFAQVAEKMKGTPGHVRDDLLRDVRDPSSYVVAGEWTSREEFQTWFDDPSHPGTTTAMRPYWEETARHGIWDVAVMEQGGSSAPVTARAMVFVELEPEQGETFESTFAGVASQVRDTPGLLANMLLRKAHQPGSYIVMSEWESKEHFLGWEDVPSHRELTKPLQEYWSGAGSSRALFEVISG